MTSHSDKGFFTCVTGRITTIAIAFGITLFGGGFGFLFFEIRHNSVMIEENKYAIQLQKHEVQLELVKMNIMLKTLIKKSEEKE